jgi:hypothetical protein
VVTKRSRFNPTRQTGAARLCAGKFKSCCCLSARTPDYSAVGWPQHNERRFMMNHSGGWTGGWMGGGMGIYTVIGVLLLVLLVIVIIKLSNK